MVKAEPLTCKLCGNRFTTVDSTLRRMSVCPSCANSIRAAQPPAEVVKPPTEAGRAKPEWVEEELARIEAERRRRFEELGFKPFFKFPEGETVVEVIAGVPARKGKYDRPILRMRIGGEEHDVPCSPVVYREILKGLSRGFWKFRVYRIGTTKTDTRYKVTPVAG